MPENENYITNKIISDARAAADAMVLDAKKKAGERLKETKKQLALEETEKLAKMQKTLEGQGYRNKLLAEIEMRKKILFSQKAIIDSVFEQAKQDIFKLKDSNYKNFIKKLIIENCADGDTVIVSKNDDKRLTNEFIKAVSTSVKKNLTRKVSDSFNGGVILSNKNYELSMTVEDLLKTLRTRIEQEVASILFKPTESTNNNTDETIDESVSNNIAEPSS